MKVSEALQKRRAIKAFDANHEISKEDLKTLVEWVRLTPSSFNMQHWRLIAAIDKDVKQKLCEAAWNQSHIAEASVTFVVCCDLKAHQDAARYWQGTPQNIQDMLVSMIGKFYDGNDQLQRDEALRSGGLISMSLMLAAQEIGYDSCPMIGFDPVKVGEIIAMPENHVAVMMVPIGKKAKDPHPKPYLIPTDEMVKIDSFSGEGLV